LPDRGYELIQERSGMHPKQDLPDTQVIRVDAGCLMTAVGQTRKYSYTFLL